MKPVLALLWLLLIATPAMATSDLLGIWDIEVTGGTAAGDGGFIVIREGQDGALVGDLTYRDADAEVTAIEICGIERDGQVVQIRCKVITPDVSTYWPDDFFLQIVGPNRMEGRLHSATTGPAVFTRREVPLS